MPGRGPAPKPKAQRRDQHVKLRGDYIAPTGIGWRGRRPICPAGLLDESQATWVTWFASWYAAFWLPADVPGLRHTIRLYDQSQRALIDPYIITPTEDGSAIVTRRTAPHTEARQMMDEYGITPKGQQDRRWVRELPASRTVAPDAAPEPYAGLVAVK